MHTTKIVDKYAVPRQALASMNMDSCLGVPPLLASLRRRGAGCELCRLRDSCDMDVWTLPGKGGLLCFALLCGVSRNKAVYRTLRGGPQANKTDVPLFNHGVEGPRYVVHCLHARLLSVLLQIPEPVSCVAPSAEVPISSLPFKGLRTQESSCYHGLQLGTCCRCPGS